MNTHINTHALSVRVVFQLYVYVMVYERLYHTINKGGVECGKVGLI